MNILLASLNYKHYIGGIENLFFFMSEQFRLQALAKDLDLEDRVYFLIIIILCPLSLQVLLIK